MRRSAPSHPVRFAARRKQVRPRRGHRSHAHSGLAAVVLFCFVAVLGAKEAVADAEAWAALQQSGAFVLMRHGAAERRNDPPDPFTRKLRP